jgi:hypothetical protein
MAGIMDMLGSAGRGFGSFTSGLGDVVQKPGVSQGLMGFGLALLSQDARTPLAQALGRAGIQGIQSYVQSKDDVEQQEARKLELAAKKASLEQYHNELSAKNAYKLSMKNALGKVKSGEFTDIKQALLSQEDLPAEQVLSLMKSEKKPRYLPFRQTVGNEIVSGFYNPENPEEQVGVVRAGRYKPDRPIVKGSGRAASTGGVKIKSIDPAKALANGQMAYNRMYQYNKSLGMRVDQDGNPAPPFESFFEGYKNMIGAQNIPDMNIPGSSPAVAGASSTPEATVAPVAGAPATPSTNGLSSAQEAMIKAIDADLKSGKITPDKAVELIKKFNINPQVARSMLGG